VSTLPCKRNGNKGIIPCRERRNCPFGLGLALSLGLCGFLFLCQPRVAAQAGPPPPQGSSSEAAASSQLLSVRLVPEEATLWGARAVQRFLVLGKYADGLERDISKRSRFSIADSGIAKVDERGRVAALADGQTVLSAQVEGRSANSRLRVEGSEEIRPFSFAQDIGGIFTKQGCNSGDCHGGVKGKGGFKLSLNALYPKDDYKWIVEGGVYQVLTAESGGPKEPRINREEPEKSVLLLKPTFSVPHGGGQRFALDSPDYETILNWIRQGAPYGEETGTQIVAVERLEIYPRSTVLDLEGTQQLLVTAHLSNGQQEDVTGQVLYVSNNPEVVQVTSEGLVKAVKTGETAVLIRAAGHAISAGFGVIAAPLSGYPEVKPRNLIDEYVLAKLRRFNIMPSGLASDEEFLRRVCLDVTGTLPPPQRVRAFLASKNTRKRDQLIEILLQSPEYVDYWTFRFADLFRVRGHYRWVHIYWEWVRKSLAGNKSYDQMARESIAAQGYDGPSRIYLIDNNKPPALERVVAEQFRVFMGRRMDCAQCHNHPYDRWKQDQFWGLGAFYRRVTNTEWAFDNVVFDDPNGHEVNFGEGKSTLAFRENRHPRTKQLVPPTFPDGRVLPARNRRDLRQELADWMTNHTYFAEAMVNRMWGHFFGRGIVDPVDDFRLGNPPTHPSLLNRLAQDFQEHGYDLKHLMRRIVSSRTYQLGSRPNLNNRRDRLNYSHAYPRPLEAEVLLDAISTVTGVPELFRAEGMLSGTAPPGTRAINLKYPASYANRFLEVFERPKRDVVVTRNGKVNLMQALHMTVSPTYNDKLGEKGGRIDGLLQRGASNREIIEELYLAALSRFPSQEEQAGLENLIRKRSSRREALEDLLWAVICSREFASNH
jgi:hypothetical protein